MKTLISSPSGALALSSIVAFILSVPLATAHAQDVNANNLSVQQAALFGNVFTDVEATTTAEGMRIDTEQGTTEVYRSSTTPGYNVDNWVTVEDYGWIDNGHWQYTNEWQIVSYDYVPATYDEDGNVITPESYEEHWDWVVTGSSWVSDTTMWGVIGTHQENQPTWIPDQTNTWVETTQGGTPRVKFNATRSDTNFAFRVPSPYGADGMKDVLVVWDGGLTLPGQDTSRTNAYSADSLQQSWWQALQDGPGNQTTTSAIRAESTTHTTAVNRLQAGVWHYDVSENQVRPETIRLTRTETVGGTSTVAQTQIAAKSASFAGVVDVAGDVKVKGVIRVLPAGDINMGAYTNGPHP